MLSGRSVDFTRFDDNKYSETENFCLERVLLHYISTGNETIIKWLDEIHDLKCINQTNKTILCTQNSLNANKKSIREIKEKKYFNGM